MHRTLIKAMAAGLVLFVHASLAGAAIIQVSIERASGAGPIEVGQPIAVNVLARVNQPASPNDGVFTFDQDLIINNPGVLQLQSVQRPGANDVPLGGSNGQVTPAGLHAVYGGYLDTTQGVGAPVLLFSANLLAAVPGTVTLTPGPAVDPYGFDFVLYQSPSPTVLYGPGLELTVIPSTVNPVPLPAGAVPGMLLGLCIVVGRCARRRRRLA